MKRGIGLSDQQLALVHAAAGTLPIATRDGFLRGVARRLGEIPTDDAVRAAIDIELQSNRIPAFLCDSVTRRRSQKG
jgi:hypothetical protein